MKRRKKQREVNREHVCSLLLVLCDLHMEKGYIKRYAGKEAYYMWLFPIITVLACWFFITNKVSYSKKLYTIIALDVLLILSVLFFHYILNIIWVFALSVSLFFAAVVMLSGIIMVIKYRKKLYFINFIVIFLSVIAHLYRVDDAIALKIELPKAKRRLEHILEDESYKSKYKAVEAEDGIYAFEYVRGILDYGMAIVYCSAHAELAGLRLVDKTDRMWYTSICIT